MCQILYRCDAERDRKCDISKMGFGRAGKRCEWLMGNAPYFLKAAQNPAEREDFLSYHATKMY
jgi:hypothetical protein